MVLDGKAVDADAQPDEKHGYEEWPVRRLEQPVVDFGFGAGEDSCDDLLEEQRDQPGDERGEKRDRQQLEPRALRVDLQHLREPFFQNGQADGAAFVHGLQAGEVATIAHALGGRIA